MTNIERTAVAEKILALAFSLREDDSQASKAWVLGVCSTALARAILATTGPKGETEPLLEIATAEVRRICLDAQSRHFRDKLTAVPGGRS